MIIPLPVSINAPLGFSSVGMSRAYPMTFSSVSMPTVGVVMTKEQGKGFSSPGQRRDEILVKEKDN